jgi:type I restriction enzyme S subunit
MTLDTFFKKFDQFADAPNAVAKMRELVLELAATGRLIPEALGRPVEEESKLMGAVVELVMGQAPAGDEYNTEGRGTVFVKVGEFGPLYPREEVWTTKPLKFAKKGDVLVCVVGATVGKLNLAIDCAIGRSAAAIRPTSALDTKFLYYSLIPYTLRLRRNSRGSAQGVIGKAELNAILLWVPTRAVQKRIVAKVDELMALCDRLEAQQQERQTRHADLARASLARFAAAPTPANLHFLFHKSYSIPPADLRKAVLTIAVQGKLVPRDPKDETASTLLEKIKEGRSKLLIDRKIRQSDDVEYSLEDEADCAPLGWIGVHVNEVAIIQGGKRLPIGATFSATPTPHVYIRVTDMKNGSILETGLRYISPAVHREIARYTINKEDLYITIAGTIGDVGSVPEFLDGHNLTENAAKIVFRGFDRKFFQLVLTSDFVQAQFLEKTKQMAQPKLALKRIAGAKFYLPPLAEQRRIVAKVDQLMALVDQLETQLADSRATAKNLLEALVTELTSSGSVSSANGASHPSLGQGPRKTPAKAIKG